MVENRGGSPFDISPPPPQKDLHQDPPLSTETNRALFIGWGADVLLMVAAIYIGGSFFPILFVLVALVMILRGTVPKLFMNHFERQVIAGTPYRREESSKKWAIAIALCFALASIGSLTYRKIVPTKPEITAVILDGVKNILHSQLQDFIGQLRSSPPYSTKPTDGNPPPSRREEPKIPIRDVRVRMVYPKNVGVQILNLTNANLEQVRCGLRVWDLDVPTGDSLLPLTNITTDWMNAHSQTSERLSDVQDNLKVMKIGDRMFGIVGIACKDCAKEHDIMFYVSPREGIGWYAPWTRKDFPDWTNLGVTEVLPQLKMNPEPYLDKWAPPSSRKPIPDSLSDMSGLESRGSK
jgi:hypothetical protein